MNIVMAETRHIPGMLALLRQVGQVHHVGRPDLFRDGAIKYNAQELETLLQDPNCSIFIAEEENVLGYCFCQIQAVEGNPCILGRKELYIDDLCVDENRRGGGIATALYRHVTKYAKTLGCAFVSLNVWCGNDGAMAFYEKMGLRPRHIMLEMPLEEENAD